MASQKKAGLALDIDETLSDTNYYWIEHLQKKFGNPEGLSAREIVEKYRYTEHVPWWQSAEALAWMEEARTSETMHEALPLIADAKHIVEKINAVVPVVAYVTARPQAMAAATERWLTTHHFPQAPIIARPEGIPHTEGTKWKAELLHSMYPQVLGIVDDNPSLVDNLPANYLGVVFLYDNVAHARTDVNVLPCKRWGDVLAAVEKYFK